MNIQNTKTTLSEEYNSYNLRLELYQIHLQMLMQIIDGLHLELI